MKPAWIARQSSLPTGWGGELVGRVMARETRSANKFARHCLPIEPDDAILEIGCGHGRTLAEIARRSAVAYAAGIDPSEVMVRIATRRLRREIQSGRVAVCEAEAAALPFEDDRFDGALGVHVLYFWSRPSVEFCEIHRVLRPGGTLVLGFRPDSPEARGSLPRTVYYLRSIAEVETLAKNSGFDVTGIRADETRPSSFVCLIARAR